MKQILILCLSLGVYNIGRCLGKCDEGTHAYTIGCDYLEPEPTCDDPHPTIDQGTFICDFMACYCDSPTVRNILIDKCVPLDGCPQ